MVEDATNWKYGFIDKSGKVVIPCQWEYASSFQEGVARVKKNNKYGYIDTSGAIIIPCKWSWALDFHFGKASVRDDDGKWYHFDKRGEIIE